MGGYVSKNRPSLLSIRSCCSCHPNRSSGQRTGSNLAEYHSVDLGTIGLALAGRTVGMAIIGLMVLTRDGATITGRQALVRALVFPFSFVIFGLGFLGIITSPERRAMHDGAAGTVVVYDWGDRPAEMPAPLTSWVNRHMEEPPSAA